MFEKLKNVKKIYLVYALIWIVFLWWYIFIIFFNQNQRNYKESNSIKNHINLKNVSEKDIKNIDNINNLNKEKLNKYSKMLLNWNLIFVNLETTKKENIYELYLKDENIVFTYDEKYEKPDFTILSWNKNYINSWNKIIFPLTKKLIFKFHNDIYLNNIRLLSWDILNIENISLLPALYQNYYSFSWNTLYNFNFPNVVQNKHINSSNSQIIKQKLWTSGQFTFLWYRRTTSNIMGMKLIWYIKKDIGDFRKDIWWKIYKENVKGIFSWDYNMYDFKDYLKINYTGDNLIVNYNNLPKDLSYKLFFIEDNFFSNNKYNYSISFETIGDLNIVVLKNLYKTQKINNYHICLNQPLDQQKTAKSIYDAIWKDKISLVFSVSDQYFGEIENENNCLMFYYYLNPEKDYTFDLNLYSLYGLNKKTTINISKYEIPDIYKLKEIIWSDINILPKNWEMWKSIQLWVKNYKNIDLSIKNCFIDKKNIIKKLKNHYVYDIPSYDILLTCWKENNQKIKISKFDYWKDILENIEIWDKNIFKASLWDWNDKLFIKTNLWLLAKKDEWNIYVWINNLDDWQPTNWVDIVLYFIKDEKLIDKKYKNINWFIKIPFITWDSLTYIVANKEKDSNFMLIWENFNSIKIGNEWKYVKGRSFIDKYDLINDYYGVESNWIKVYAYTDRVLYKPWDDVFVSWWIRNVEKNQVFKTWEVNISLYYDWQKIDSLQSLKLDNFWWFIWKLVIPKSAELWNYYIQVDSNIWKTYIQYIQVQEYKKSTFNIFYEIVYWKYLRINPIYYFWKNLDKYDLSVYYSFNWKHDWLFDFNRCNKDTNYYEDKYTYYCDEPIYYNFKLDEDENYSKKYNINNYTWWYIDIPLSWFDNKFFWTLNYDINVIDKASNEVVYKTFSLKKFPKYIIWFIWGPYDWLYGKNDNIILTWKVLKYIENDNYDQQIWLYKFQNIKNDKVEIKIYQKYYQYDKGKWPDGELYYMDWSNYKFIKSDIANIKDSNFNYAFKVKDWWEYFIRAIYKGYEVQKIVNYYKDWYDFWWYYGNIKNNFVLDLNIKDKEYKPGDDLQIDINPYIKQSYAIITIEQWNKIKDIKTQILDWNPIILKVKKDWFPNVYISVVLIAWENISSKDLHRKEPRFYIWYDEIKLNKNLYNLNFSIKVLDRNLKEKEYFSPWEEINLEITTFDNDNVLKDARLSVWIVDKALLDIYDELRKPIEYFYNRYWNYILNLAIYKNIYKTLKVFSADYKKWWGWWDESFWILNLRKNFYDLAFWKWWVYTKNWKLILATKLPDNITTWVVDIIGITKDGEMWTFRKEFKVSKDIILQPNLPSFATIEDKIYIPYKIVKNKNIKNFKVISYVELNNKKYNLEQKNNSFLFDMSSFSYEDIYKSDMLDIYMKVKDDKKVYDSIQTKIPIRKNWFMISQFMFVNTNKLEKTFYLEPKAKYGIVNISLSDLPIWAFEKAFNYLLHYPYWCTEQLMSWLYPIIVADILSKHNLLSLNIINKWQINLVDWYDGSKIQNINQVIQDTLWKIYKNQKIDWGMWYWPESDESADPFLSVYVYGAFKQIEKNWYKVNQEFIKKLENYILHTDNKNIIMYYYLQKIFVGEKIDRKFVKENINNDDVSKVLSYIILSLSNKNYKNDKLKDEIESILVKDNLSEWSVMRDWVFLDNFILKSLYIQAIHDNLSDKYVMELLKNRDKEWVWDYSTQKNVQALLALWKYMIRKHFLKNITYNININGNEFTWKVEKNWTNIVYSFENKNSIAISLNSSDNLLYDLKIEYFPENINNLKTQENNVNLFELWAKLWNETTWWLIKEKLQKANIWDMIDFIWGFNLNKDAYHLAISFYIPSNVELLNPSLNKNSNILKFVNASKFNYTISDDKNRDWYDCTPSHYEVRFDRLFLYYDKIKKDRLCKIIFKWVKTHDWAINIMLSKLFEMYNTNVWSEKVFK